MSSTSVTKDKPASCYDRPASDKLITTSLEGLQTNLEVIGQDMK